MADHDTNTSSSHGPTSRGATRERDAEADQGPNNLWWQCPYCSTVSLNTMAQDNTGARGALQSHILASKGDGHGPSGSYPEDFDPATLDDYISTVNPRQ